MARLEPAAAAGGWAGLRAKVRLLRLQQDLHKAAEAAAQAARGLAACEGAAEGEEAAYEARSARMRAAYAKRRAALQAAVDARLVAVEAEEAGMTDVERNRAALSRALGLSGAGGAEEAGEAEGAWDDAMATRVARQLVFARSDWSARQCVAQLDSLADAAGRGEAEAERKLRALARLTRQLEQLQRRSARDEEDQGALEQERRALSEQMRTWAGGLV